MKYYEGCEEITREKTRDFQAKMKLGYDFKKAYAARRAWEFYNHPEVAGRCYVAVGGLDSITLFPFLRSIGIDVPATSVSMLEDRSIQRVHKALGVKGLLPGQGWEHHGAIDGQVGRGPGRRIGGNLANGPGEDGTERAGGGVRGLGRGRIPPPGGGTDPPKPADQHTKPGGHDQGRSKGRGGHLHLLPGL